MILRRIKHLVLASLIALVGLLAVMPAHTSYAVDPAAEIKSGVNGAGGSGNNNFGKMLKTIVNVLLFIVGSVAVIMIVVGGLRYTLSGGDQAQITSAKNTILYSIIGLVIAILSFAIVNWVLKAFTG